MKEEMEKLAAEYDRKKCLVTCEFSFHRSKLDEFILLSTKIKSQLGVWRYRECEACKYHFGENYLHAEIV